MILDQIRMFNDTNLESMEKNVNLWIQQNNINNIVDVVLSSEFIKMEPDLNNRINVKYHYTVCVRYKKAVELEEAIL